MTHLRGWRLRRSQPATKPAIVITSSFSLWDHSLLRPGYPRGSRLLHSQPTTKQTILIMTSLATELATPSVTDVRTCTYAHLTAFNI